MAIRTPHDSQQGLQPRAPQGLQPRAPLPPQRQPQRQLQQRHPPTPPHRTHAMMAATAATQDQVASATKSVRLAMSVGVNHQSTCAPQDALERARTPVHSHPPRQLLQLAAPLTLRLGCPRLLLQPRLLGLQHLGPQMLQQRHPPTPPPLPPKPRPTPRHHMSAMMAAMAATRALVAFATSLAQDILVDASPQSTCAQTMVALRVN